MNIGKFPVQQLQKLYDILETTNLLIEKLTDIIIIVSKNFIL